MHKSRLFILISLLGLVTAGVVLISPVNAQQGYVFTRTLFLGSRGEDVRNLQKVLNSDSRTRVALSGPGSLGNETDLFGFLTKQGVIKYQELYKTEILTPVGLVAGTGIVGPSTRSKLNQAQHVVVAPVVQAKVPLLTRAQPSSVSPGNFVTLYGSNLLGPSTIRAGSTVIVGSSKDSSTLTFPIPQGMSGGTHKVTVEIGGQKSNEILLTVLASGSASASAPRITSLTPSRGGKNTVVTITGSGFARTNNTVYTGYGVVSGVASSDGKKLQVTLTPPFGKPITGISYTIPLWMYVVNSGGTSNEAIFTYEP